MNYFSEILKLAKELISIKSITGNSEELEQILELALSNLEGFAVERFDKNGIKSALVYNTDKRPKKFKIILNGHLDVIPGKKYQYRPRIIGDKLYGVGSMDMKASAACLIMVFKEVAGKVDYPFALQLVTDEQSGSQNGTQYQIDEGVRGDFIITGESSNFNIINRAKGVIWIKILAKGKSAHSAYPWKGENAIWKMNEFLNLLKQKYPSPKSEVWKTTVNISYIGTSNVAINKIPDICEAWLDIRYIPRDHDVVLKEISKLLPQNFNFEIVYKEPPLLVNENNTYLYTLQKSAERVLKNEVLLSYAHGTSDATCYSKVGCPAVEFGPISENGNTNNEFINIPSLEKYYLILIKFLLNLKA